MNLTVRINEVEYSNNCVQGLTFADQYNETLDSGTIRITHVPRIIDLHPYDDVYIYDSDRINFSKDALVLKYGGTTQMGDVVTAEKFPDYPFYRHLLVDQFTENAIKLGSVDTTTGETTSVYDYTIELFSETKGLEAIQLPNRSSTQPLKTSLKKSIYKYLEENINLYSPKIKTLKKYDNGGYWIWEYKPKYTLSTTLQLVFWNTYSPDFTMSNPNLRDVVSQFMIVKDRIPYVKDGIIYAMDITKRNYINTTLIDERDAHRMNSISATLTSDDYCDSVRRQYSNALSQNGTCNYVEHLGFRNKNSAIMTLENMQLETTYPIYKINKLYMCYYKRGVILYPDGTTDTRYFLCKQDITKLAKLDSEWGLLNQDWDALGSTPPKNIDELASYKLSTVSYSSGSNIISGWGVKYNMYQTSASGLSGYNYARTYLENILKYVDKLTPFGIYSDDYVLNIMGEPSTSVFIPDSIKDNDFSAIFSPSSNDQASALKLKGLFFEIEYSSFYNGALIHSRDLGRDNIVHNDNSSSSLVLLEKDGLNQKEKMNRFANKNYLLKGRYTNVNNLFQLGDVIKVDEDDDVIIYKREFSIYDNVINVSYAGMQDYVLKNYFTTVYAKYRTYQLMSYGESVTRAENRKNIYLLSKTKAFIDDVSVSGININKLFSMFKSSPNYTTAVTTDILTDNINCGYIGNDTEGASSYHNKEFAADEHTFTSGNSICFNLSMTDNISGGNYIKQWVSNYKSIIYQPSGTDSNYVVGSIQDWYNMVDSTETGYIERMRFRFGHKDSKETPWFENISDGNAVYSTLSALPATSYNLLNTQGYLTNQMLIEGPIYKDNKELINMTIQLEPISDAPNDIVVGEWFMKLSDLLSTYHKTNGEYQSQNLLFHNSLGGLPFDFMGIYSTNYVAFCFPMTDATNNMELNLEYVFNVSQSATWNYHGYLDQCSIKYTATKIKKTGDQEYKVWGVGEIKTYKYVEGVWGLTSIPITESTPITLLNVIGQPKQIGGVSYDNWFELRFSQDQGFTEDVFNANMEYINSTSALGYIYTIYNKNFTIKKNMFLRYSTNNIDKTSIYDEYEADDSSFKATLVSDGTLISDIFELKHELNRDFIRVHLTNVPNTTKSIQYWFLDDSKSYLRDDSQDTRYLYSYAPEFAAFHFVFGTNVKQEDFTRGYVDIYISAMSNRDTRVFDASGKKVANILGNPGDITIIKKCVLDTGAVPLLSLDQNKGTGTDLELTLGSVVLGENQILKKDEVVHVESESDNPYLTLKVDLSGVEIVPGTKIETNTTFEADVKAIGNVVVSSNLVAQEYTLTLTDVEQAFVTALRLESPYKGAGIGVLSSGDKIYSGDVIAITPGRTASGVGYEPGFTQSGFETTEIPNRFVTIGNATVTATATLVTTRTLTFETHQLNEMAKVSVSRTLSPRAGAGTGSLNSGDTLYDGDIISVISTPVGQALPDESSEESSDLFPVNPAYTITGVVDASSSPFNSGVAHSHTINGNVSITCAFIGAYWHITLRRTGSSIPYVEFSDTESSTDYFDLTGVTYNPAYPTKISLAGNSVLIKTYLTQFIKRVLTSDYTQGVPTTLLPPWEKNLTYKLIPSAVVNKLQCSSIKYKAASGDLPNRLEITGKIVWVSSTHSSVNQRGYLTQILQYYAD